MYRIFTTHALPVDIDKNILTISVMGFFISMGTSIVAPIVPELTAYFEVSYGDVGMMMSAYGLARLLLDLPVGLVADRWNKKFLLIAGATAVSVGGVMGFLSDNFTGLVISRAVMGAGSSIAVTTGMIYVSQLSTVGNRGRTLGFFTSSLMAGAAFSPVVGGYLAMLFGWRTALLFCGLIAFVSLIWVLLAFKGMSSSSGEALGQSLAGNVSGTGRRPIPGTGGKRLAGAIGVVLFLAFAVQFSWTGFRHVLISVYGSAELGLDLSTIGLVLTVSASAGTLALFLSGFLSDRWGRVAVIVPGMMLLGIGMLWMPYTVNFAGFLGSVLIISLGGMVHSVPITLVSDLSPPASVARNASGIRFVGDLAQFAGPVTLGTLVDYLGFRAAVAFPFAMVVVSTVLVLAFANTRRYQGKTGSSKA